MATNEMVERVAKAIYESPIGGDPYAPRWDDMREKHKDTFRDLARDAIVAMREPTEEMINSGRAADNGSDRNLGEAGAKEAWKLMIDAALK